MFIPTVMPGLFRVKWLDLTHSVGTASKTVKLSQTLAVSLTDSTGVRHVKIFHISEAAQ